MAKKELSFFNKIKDWFYFNDDLSKGIFTILVFASCYLYFTKSLQTIDVHAYNMDCELIDYNFKKIYALPEIYSTKRKLDHIIINLKYIHNEKKYESTAVIYWVNISPIFQKAIEEKDFEKLTIRCKKESPNQAMLFLN